MLVEARGAVARARRYVRARKTTWLTHSIRNPKPRRFVMRYLSASYSLVPMSDYRSRHTVPTIAIKPSSLIRWSGPRLWEDDLRQKTSPYAVAYVASMSRGAAAVL